MAEYDIGQAITSTATFRNAAGTATDPTTVTATLLAPDGTSTTPTITSGGTGIRSISFTPTTAGTWVVTWVGTGAVTDREYGVYVVRPGYAWDPLAVLTLDEAKRAINLETDNTDHDAELLAFATAVSRRMDALVGPVVQRDVEDEIHDGGSGYSGVLILRNPPVASVTTLTEWSGTSSQAIAAEVLGTPTSYDYSLSSASGLVYRRSGGSDAYFAAGRGNLVVTYVAGRAASTAAVDARFKTAAAAALRRLWQRESGIWAQSPRAFEETAPVDFGGFFRAIDPVITELLSDQLLAPAVA